MLENIPNCGWTSDKKIKPQSKQDQRMKGFSKFSISTDTKHMGTMLWKFKVTEHLNLEKYLKFTEPKEVEEE